MQLFMVGVYLAALLVDLALATCVLFGFCFYFVRHARGRVTSRAAGIAYDVLSVICAAIILINAGYLLRGWTII